MKQILTLSIFLSGLLCQGQHLKIKKKELAFLKQQDSISVVINYTDIRYQGENFSEASYIKNRQEKFIKNSKDFKAWEEAFFSYKTNHWPNAYTEHLNQSLKKHKAPYFFTDANPSTEYVLHIYVDWIYFGYDVGIGRWPSKIKLTLNFVETITGNVVSRILVSESRGGNNAEGNDSDWPSFERVENAFYNSGFKLGIALKRLFKKK